MIVTLVLAVCTVFLSVVTYLNVQRSFFPGWTELSENREWMSPESLIFHDGRLWLVYTSGLPRERETGIMYTEDGIEWSPPYVFLKESKEGSLYYGVPRWLKRPTGDLWLVWSSGIRTSDVQSRILHYARLEEEGTVGLSHEIHQYSTDYSFDSIANTPDGGVIIMMVYWPPDYYIIDGRQVRMHVFTGCVVQSADENREWNPPLLLSETDLAQPHEIYLDHERVIWALYEESYPIKGVYFQTSRNGSLWNGPRKIPINAEVTTFFQRHNGEYVLFFIDDDSAYMMTSPDGSKWSNPQLVYRTQVPHEIADALDEYTRGKPYDVIAAESDDGTLWAAIDCGQPFLFAKYSDEQCLKDLKEMRDFHMKNGAVACGVAAISGAILLFLWKKFFE